MPDDKPLADVIADEATEAIAQKKTTMAARLQTMMMSDVRAEIHGVLVRRLPAVATSRPDNDGTTPKQRNAVRKTIPPTPEQVTAYSALIGYPMNGQQWCDFYAAKGWMVGKTRMKDWQAAVRNWKTNGWGAGNIALTGARPQQPVPQHEHASLGALQIQLKKIEDEMEGILYPGGAAFKTIPTGDKLERYKLLQAQREGIKGKIARFAA